MMMIVKSMSLFATLLVASGLIACSGAFADTPEEEEPAAVPAEEEQEDDSELESMRGLADQQLSIGELRHFNARHISRIIIEDLAVVQVEPFGDGRQLSMTGVATGETNIQIFFGDDEVYDVSVRVVSEGAILEPDQVWIFEVGESRSIDATGVSRVVVDSTDVLEAPVLSEDDKELIFTAVGEGVSQIEIFGSSSDQPMRLRACVISGSEDSALHSRDNDCIVE